MANVASHHQVEPAVLINAGASHPCSDPATRGWASGLSVRLMAACCKDGAMLKMDFQRNSIAAMPALVVD